MEKFGGNERTLPSSIDIARKPFLAITLFFMATVFETVHILSLPDGPGGVFLIISLAAVTISCCIPCWFYHSAEIENHETLICCAKISGVCALGGFLFSLISLIFFFGSLDFDFTYLALFFLLFLSSVLFASSAKETYKTRTLSAKKKIDDLEVPLSAIVPDPNSSRKIF